MVSLAAQLGEIDILCRLIDNGGWINFKNLTYTLDANEDECLRKLLEICPPNELKFCELMERAVDAGFWKCLRVLLEYYNDKKKLQTIMKLAINKNRALCVRELVENGMGVEKISRGH